MAAPLCQLLLRDAQCPDERLCGLEALGHNGFGGRLRAAVDEFDDVVGGLGLDHHDRDIITDDAARDHHVEHRALQLRHGRERHPGPSISATRTPPTGPENGSPENWVDADAALIASTS